MAEFFNQFHFIRPLWLWVLLPLLAVLVLLYKKQQANNSWSRIIAPELLPFLTENTSHGSGRNYLLPLGIGWLLAVIALAGPTWQKLPQPVHRQTDALVVVLDLSLSMLATDQEPSRLIKARRKLSDLLKIRKEGLTGLVVFSGDAHSVSPLTDDSKTIAELVPALSPQIMPVYGSNLMAGLTEATKLIEQGGAAKQSRVIVFTDGVHPSSVELTLKQAKNSGYPISVLAFGTVEGSPIPKPNGGFLKDGTGSIVIPKLDAQPLKEIAAISGGRYLEPTIDDSDIRQLLDNGIGLSSARQTNQPDDQITRELNLWVERGPWLILPLLLLVLPAFRKGWIFALLLVINMPQPAMAFEWRDLWKTPDQQGMEAMQSQQHEQAAELFQNPQWKGSAHFKKGDYEKAAEQFATADSATAHYNRGNALAMADKLEEALDAYDQALKKDPQLADAVTNKQLVDELLKQQKKQEPSDSSKEDGKPSDSQQKPDQDQNQGQDQNQNGQQQQDQQNNNQQSAGDSSEHQQTDPSDQPFDQDGSPTNSTEQSKQEPNKKQEEQPPTDPSKPDAPSDQNKKDSEPDANNQSQSHAELSKEQLQQKQKTEQMLRRLPDNPGVLFQRKFQQQYLNNQQNRNRQSGTNNQEPMW
ncbi:MAG: VWA domain-containing protein [Pseudomonadales bacterium]|nr:VWA domain-containing protein [Pseudomonadales bacterium]